MVSFHSLERVGKSPERYYFPDQSCPIELSVIMETVYICAFRYSGHQPCVVMEHLKRGYCNWETVFAFNS